MPLGLLILKITNFREVAPKHTETYHMISHFPPFAHIVPFDLIVPKIPGLPGKLIFILQNLTSAFFTL